MTVSLTYLPTLPAVVCQPVPLTPAAYDIFGGGQFALQLLPRLEDELTSRARALFGLSNSTAAHSSFIIALRVLGGILTVVQGLTSVPPDVAKISSGLTAIGAGSASFLTLVNLPVALARTALAYRDQLVGFLVALRNQIVAVQARYTDLNARLQQAQQIGNQALIDNLTCAKERLDAKVAQFNAVLAAVAVAIQLASTILCIVTGGHLPALPVLNPSNLVVDGLNEVIAVLQALSIPNVPGVSVSC